MLILLYHLTTTRIQLLPLFRGDLVFVFNFHPTNSFTDYKVGCYKPGNYKVSERHGAPSLSVATAHGWVGCVAVPLYTSSGPHAQRLAMLLGVVTGFAALHVGRRLY